MGSLPLSGFRLPRDHVKIPRRDSHNSCGSRVYRPPAAFTPVAAFFFRYEMNESEEEKRHRYGAYQQKEQARHCTADLSPPGLKKS
jgi:hypothetical protein